VNVDVTMKQMADVAIAVSGSVVLELAVSNVPTVVAYDANFITKWFIKRNVIIPYASLPNILLNKPVVPECLFENCRPLVLVQRIK
jgi:lipid-A-disaccharide synthase